MKRFRALIIALAMLAFATGACAGTDVADATRSKLDQARATKNPAACVALLLSVVNAPGSPDGMVAEAIDFAWDSDLVSARDMIDLMLAVMDTGRPELYSLADDLPYMLAYTGRVDEAVGILRERGESDPDNAGIYEDELLDVLMFGDRSDEAIAILADRIAAKTGTPDTYARLANLLNMNGRHDETIGIAETGLAADPQNTLLWQYYAEALDHELRYAEAADALQSMLRAEQAQGLDVTYTYAMLYGAQARAGRWREAERSLEHALSGSQETSLFLERARFKIWDLFDPEAALKDLDALIKRDPDYTDAITQRAYAYLWLDRFDEAFADARTVAEYNGESPDILQAVVDHYSGDTNAADISFELIAQKDPSSADAWFFRALNALYGEADVDAADEYLQIASSIAGDNADIISLQGDAARFRGRWTQAGEMYLAAADLVYDDPGPLNSLGALQCERGMLDEARATLARSEKEYPNHYWTLCLKLSIEAADGDFAAALNTYADIAKQFPSMAERSLGYTRAALAAMAGRIDEARDALGGLEPASPEDALSAAECFALLGDFGQAREMLERFADTADSSGLTPADRMEADIVACLVEAETAYLQGDESACLDWMRKACERGWYPESAKGNWILKAMASAEGYEALALEYPVE